MYRGEAPTGRPCFTCEDGKSIVFMCQKGTTMPAPDLEERFRRWIKLIAEMHDNANFTPNASIAWTPMRKPLRECSVALVSTAGVHLKSQPAHDLRDPHGDPSFLAIPGATPASNIASDHSHYDTT